MNVGDRPADHTLSEGTFTLVYGEDEVSFTLPMEDDVCTSPVPSG